MLTRTSPNGLICNSSSACSYALASRADLVGGNGAVGGNKSVIRRDGGSKSVTVTPVLLRITYSHR